MLSLNASNIHVYGSGEMRVSVVGVDDITIVFSSDKKDVLIIKKGQGEKVKKIAQALERG